MNIVNDVKQGTAEWDEMRAVVPTASEFGKILTGTGKPSVQREAYMRKLAVNRKYALPTWKGNYWTERGQALEPIARTMFADLSGLDVREAGFIQHGKTIAGGSPDGLIYDVAGRPFAGLEIKCYNEEKHLDIIAKSKLPTDNMPQVHGHLWMTGFDAWAFVVYNPDCMPFDFKAIEVVPTQYTADLGGAVTEFCVELERRADEFISDFEARMDGSQVLADLPVIASNNMRRGGFTDISGVL